MEHCRGTFFKCVFIFFNNHVFSGGLLAKFEPIAWVIPKPNPKVNPMSQLTSKRSFSKRYSEADWSLDMQYALSSRGAFELDMTAVADTHGWDMDALWLQHANAHNDLAGEDIESRDPETIHLFFEHHDKTLKGDTEAALLNWSRLQDWGRYRYATHMWAMRKRGKISAEVWGRILELTWRRGKSGCLLMALGAQPNDVCSMFYAADQQTMMDRAGEFQRFEALPAQFVVWRGTTIENPNSEDGFSWTLNRARAKWFAFRNSRGSDSPVLIKAIVNKEAVLSAFDFENEVVVSAEKGLTMINRRMLERGHDAMHRNLRSLKIQATAPKREGSKW